MDYAATTMAVATAIINAHREDDSATLATTLDTLPRTLAQDVITALLIVLDPQDHG